MQLHLHTISNCSKEAPYLSEVGMHALHASLVPKKCRKKPKVRIFHLRNKVMKLMHTCRTL